MPITILQISIGSNILIGDISMTIYTQNQYVVYHITYSGNLLPSKNNSNITPSNYIGSTSLKQIESGYMGSVSSKKYKVLWKQELKEHPELFNLEIISYHDTRSDATWKELQLQKTFNVLNNPLFVNMSYASINGFCGLILMGSDNPNFGNKGFTSYTYDNGTIIYAHKSDPRVVSGELCGIKTNPIKSNMTKSKNPNMKKYEFIILQTPTNEIIRLNWNEYSSYFKHNKLNNIISLKKTKNYKIIDFKLNNNWKLIPPIKQKSKLL